MKDLSTLIQEAYEAGYAAAYTYQLENPTQWYPCGFAWVNIKPARGPLVKKLKELKIGRTDEYYGGYTIWNPSENSSQCLDVKHAGAKAYAEVLQKAGFNVTVGTRID